MKIILVRHAATDHEGEMEDHLINRPLSNKGLEQADKLGKELPKDVPKVDLIYCSPMVRAIETGGYLSRAYEIPLHVTPDIADIGYQGRTPVEVRRLATNFLRNVLRGKEDAVVIVGHRQPGIMMASVLTGKSEDDIGDIGLAEWLLLEGKK